MTPGGDVTLMHAFDGFEGGSRPAGPLIQASDGHLYGTTEFGGNAFEAG
jgi:hypothetical protein